MNISTRNPVYPAQNTDDSNMIDITNLSDAALDVYLQAKANDGDVDIKHLTITERYWVVNALGIEVTAAVSYWIHSA